MNPVGILLAAGRGRRFDPTGARNKLLAPLAGAGGEPVAAASARTLLAVLPKVIAVVRPGDDGVASALRALGCDVTVCPEADQGMGASLAHGVGHSVRHFAHNSPAAPQSWLIALGDMPHLQQSTIEALAIAVAGGAIIAAPVLGGKRGNPVAFGAVCLPHLLALGGDEGARRLLKLYPVTEVVVDDPGIFQDVDSPADLNQRSSDKLPRGRP
ncbi:MAG: molybdopterin-guanine dinucleotide biosynthesis protein MobA [Massilia sp.]|jgi:molybdenum cofactor cytidylyltransferase|nr:molybdopterin-guanine dinucleotide biosynthesis protein MobA [Massilia sp.]